LFDRSGRYPVLTQAGVLLLADARSVVANVDRLKARAKGISGGLEPELSVVIDVLFPFEAIAETAHQFRDEFPRTPLRGDGSSANWIGRIPCCNMLPTAPLVRALARFDGGRD